MKERIYSIAGGAMIPDSLSKALDALDVFEVPDNAPSKPTVLVSLLGVVTVLDDFFSSVAVPSASAPVIPSGSQAANSAAAPETATSAATNSCIDGCEGHIFKW